MRIMESRAQMRKEKTMDRIGGATGLVRRLMLGSIVLLASISLLTGCGRQQAESPESSSSADVAESSSRAGSSCVIVDDAFLNLQLTDPTIPVYDKYTLSERRAKGLTTTMPDLTPYKEGKVVYLTFDDGPDEKNTPAILDILKENGVQATFYVTGQHAELHLDVLQRIYAEHHAIGNHSYDHDYKKLYVSPETFLSEMEPLILRAPGGVIGHFTKAYDPALKASGYVEHDWNVSSADAAPNHPVAQDFIDNIDSQTDKPVAAHAAIILMHCSEGHEETVKALPEIIRILKAKGYTFGVITPMTPQPW